jgi:Putative prokaryotic signal transducing protein
MADLVRVWATNDPIEAELLRGALEAEEIPVLLNGEGTGPYRAGAVYIVVPAGEEIRARVLIDALRSGVFAASQDDADEVPGRESTST